MASQSIFMRERIILMFVLVLALVTLTTSARANVLSTASLDSIVADEPHQSVGLVLSGGGAKGIAHIGVIKALEEHNIPIDYVAGTSMGAIVGGLYCMGYTTDEMMDMIKSDGFAEWSSGQINEKLVYYFVKPEANPALFNIPITSSDSTQVNSILPTSVISPLPMNFAFMDLFSAYTAQCGGDFNKLMVPFRCVTSNIYTKRKMVLSSGSLGDAIRASMSFPGVFEPIEMDGVLVYDGGIYDNFPVDVMREDFAPSIMIGVDVSAPDGKPKAGDLLNQLEDMIIQNNDYSLPADEGIKVKVDVERFGLLDWKKADVIYQAGYDRAMEMMDSIETRVTARVLPEDRELRRRVFKSKSPYLRFDSVEVTGGTRSQNEFLKSLFFKNREDTFGIAQARMAYYRAITPGQLRNLVPQAVYDDTTGLFTLKMKATVKSGFKVGAGGYITSSTNSMIFLSGGYSTLSYHGFESLLNGWIGQSYMAAALRARVYMTTRNPSAFDLTAVVTRQKFYDNAALFYEDKMPTFIIDTEVFGRLSYAWAMGRSGKAALSVGGAHIYDSFYQNDIGNYSDTGRDRTVYNLAQVRLDWERNTLDYDNYPTAGAKYRLVAEGVTGRYHFNPFHSSPYPSRDENQTWVQAEFTAHNYFGMSKHFVLGTCFNAMFSNRPLDPDYNAAIVNAPAYHPTPSSYNAFNPAFRANSYVAAGLCPIWLVKGAFQIRGDFHCFLPYKKIEHQADGITTRYGHVFSNPAFFGELAAVYNFPFASLSLYGNYLSYPARNWNFGISFGLFILAPKFLR